MCDPSALSNNNSKKSSVKYHQRLAELGASCLETHWMGHRVTHRVQCKNNDHPVSNVQPYEINRGTGVCYRCAYRSPKQVATRTGVFYVVTNYADNTIKVGHTSNNPKSRLYKHRVNGFDHAYCLLKNLKPEEGVQMESFVLSRLHEMGIQPVKGNEYFADKHLLTVVDIVHARMKDTH